MISQKNKNKSFFYEEEIDQSYRESRQGGTKSKNETINDSKIKDVILRIEGEDFRIDKERLNPVIQYIKEFYDKATKKYQMPRWLEKKYFELYLNAIQTSKVLKFDLLTCKKLVDISLFFNNEGLIKNIIKEGILPNLDKSSCVTILSDYIKEIYKDETKHLFIDLVQNCIDISSKNIFYLINNKQEDLLSMGEDSFEEIIERYFEGIFFKTNIDHSNIMRLMIKNRKLNDIFELLENERKRAISIFEKIFEEGLEATIIWKLNIDNPKNGIYKESEEFSVQNINLILINYYDTAKDVYSIAIKITGKYSEENLDTQFILSVLSICEIKEIGYRSKINFNCIFSNNRTKILVTKIENFSKLFPTFDEKIEYSQTIYFNISYNFSAILTHICKNFYEYHSLNSISKISRNVLNIILKNEALNVRNDDEVLYSIITWINNKQAVNIELAEELFQNVNWKNVSLDGLLDFILNESKLLMNSVELQTIAITEFKRRFTEEYNASDQTLIFESPTKKNNKNHSLNSTNPGDVLSPRPANFSNSGGGFTTELILKLIKIASKYETQYKTGTNVTTTTQNKSSSEKSKIQMNQENMHNTDQSPDDSIQNKVESKKSRMTPPSEGQGDIADDSQSNSQSQSHSHGQIQGYGKKNNRDESSSPMAKELKHHSKDYKDYGGYDINKSNEMIGLGLGIQMPNSNQMHDNSGLGAGSGKPPQGVLGKHGENFNSKNVIGKKILSRDFMDINNANSSAEPKLKVNPISPSENKQKEKGNLNQNNNSPSPFSHFNDANPNKLKQSFGGSAIGIGMGVKSNSGIDLRLIQSQSQSQFQSQRKENSNQSHEKTKNPLNIQVIQGSTTNAKSLTSNLTSFGQLKYGSVQPQQQSALNYGKPVYSNNVSSHSSNVRKPSENEEKKREEYGIKLKFESKEARDAPDVSNHSSHRAKDSHGQPQQFLQNQHNQHQSLTSSLSKSNLLIQGMQGRTHDLKQKSKEHSNKPQAAASSNVNANTANAGSNVKFINKKSVSSSSRPKSAGMRII